MTFDEWSRVALGFVLEDESWPVFYEWLRTQPHSTTAQTYLDHMNTVELLHHLRTLFVNSSTLQLRD